MSSSSPRIRSRRDAAELYGPPDGYIDADGDFQPRAARARATSRSMRSSFSLRTGSIRCPTWPLQEDGSPWEEETVTPAARTRQGFFPDGSRSFEEIDRLSIGVDGQVNLIGGRAEVDFYRVAPPGGFTKGLAGRQASRQRARRHAGRTPADGTSSPTSRFIWHSRRRGRSWPRSPTTCRRSCPRAI